MKMGDQSFHDIFHASVFTSGIDENRIVSDVLNGEILQRRQIDE